MAKKDAATDEKPGKKEKKARTPRPQKKGAKKSPLLLMREKFGSKEDLVKELKKLFDKSDIFIDKLNPDKGLERVSNDKLLRLHALAGELKEKFGTRKALIDEYVKLANLERVKNIREKLEGLTLGRLMDLYRQAVRKGRKAAGKQG